jgi:hypothetical protein
MVQRLQHVHGGKQVILVAAKQPVVRAALHLPCLAGRSLTAPVTMCCAVLLCTTAVPCGAWRGACVC